MKITRAKDNRLVAGVCAGLAKEFGWDVNMVRLVTVVLAVATVSTVVPLAYLVAWLLLPEEGGRVVAHDIAGEMGKQFGRPSADPRIEPRPAPGAWQQTQWQQQPGQQEQPQQQAGRGYR